MSADWEARFNGAQRRIEELKDHIVQLEAQKQDVLEMLDQARKTMGGQMDRIAQLEVVVEAARKAGGRLAVRVLALPPERRDYRDEEAIENLESALAALDQEKDKP